MGANCCREKQWQQQLLLPKSPERSSLQSHMSCPKRAKLRTTRRPFTSTNLLYSCYIWTRIPHDLCQTQKSNFCWRLGWHVNETKPINQKGFHPWA